MANMTERNGLVLLLLVSYQPSFNAYIFSFRFFPQFEFVLLCFCFVLFCFFSFNFPSWYQFNFVSFSCWKFNFSYFFHNYDNYAMFRDVPECSMFLFLSTPFHLAPNRNFRNFWPNGKRPERANFPPLTTRTSFRTNWNVLIN